MSSKTATNGRLDIELRALEEIYPYERNPRQNDAAVACEQTGRRGMMMELEPAFADVIVERWEKFAGRKAERIAAAKPEVEAESEVSA